MKFGTDSTRVYDAIPQLGRLREQVLIGDVWQQPELSLRDRVLVTCSVLASTGKVEELKTWMARGLDSGVTEDEFRGLVVQVAFYAGWPSGLAAGRALVALLDERQGT